MEQLKYEFFTGDDGHVWYRTPEKCVVLTSNDYDVIDFMLEHISKVFPEAISRLSYMFKDSELNRQFFNFKIVERFVRCNMGDDNQQKLDINEGYMNLERVSCPLRGVCKDEGIICCPKPNSSMSKEEQKVAVLYSSGFSVGEIAKLLTKSFSTVNNQLWNITKRLGLSSRRELIIVCKNFNLL